MYRDSNHPDIASSYSNIGSVHYSQREYVKALEWYNKSLTIRLTVYRDSNHPDIATSYSNIGTVYESQGEYVKAMECHNKSQAIRSACKHKWLLYHRITSAFLYRLLIPSHSHHADHYVWLLLLISISIDIFIEDMCKQLLVSDKDQ